MPPPYCYDHPRPAVTVDVTAFTLLDGGLRVLLVKRKAPPFEGRWALPGGFLDIDEPIEDGARRELREETGLDVPGPVEFIGVFGDPGRDPRGRTITLAHATVVCDPGPVAGTDDAAEAAWLDPHASLELAFDHGQILAGALEWLRGGSGWRALRLLPDEFGTSDLKVLIGAVDLPRFLGRVRALQRHLFLTGRIEHVEGMSDRFRAATVGEPMKRGQDE